MSGEHRAMPATTQKGLYEAEMSTDAHATMHRGRNSAIEHESGSLSIQLFLLMWRRPDGIVVDKKKEICYVLEFKRKMDRWMWYREETTDRATNQYASLMHGLQGASKWTVHLVIIVGGMCGSVHTQRHSTRTWNFWV